MTEYTWTDSGVTGCPYCKHEQNYTGDPLGEDDSTDIECNNCHATYEVVMHIMYRHEGRKK
jgi:hypothetical protein